MTAGVALQSLQLILLGPLCCKSLHGRSIDRRTRGTRLRPSSLWETGHTCVAANGLWKVQTTDSGQGEEFHAVISKAFIVVPNLRRLHPLHKTFGMKYENRADKARGCLGTCPICYFGVRLAAAASGKCCSK